MVTKNVHQNVRSFFINIFLTMSQLNSGKREGFGSNQESLEIKLSLFLQMGPLFLPLTTFVLGAFLAWRHTFCSNDKTPNHIFTF
jgi:hypothetical protein